MGLQFEVAPEPPDLTLPEGKIFRAKLMELKLHEFTWTADGVQKNGSILQWWWEITSTDEYNGRRVKGECDPVINRGTRPRDKFRPWAEALLDRDLPLGMKVDADDLVGLSADITIRHQADKKDPARKYELVDDVMPPAGAAFVDQPPF